MLTTMNATSMRSILGGANPFKVQVNFDIPLFEGNIYVDSLDKWLSVLEGYFSFQTNFDDENITFTLLKSLTISKSSGTGTMRCM